MSRMKDSDSVESKDPQVLRFIEQCDDTKYDGPMPNFSSRITLPSLGEKYRCVNCGKDYPTEDKYWGPSGDCSTCTKRQKYFTKGIKMKNPPPPPPVK